MVQDILNERVWLEQVSLEGRPDRSYTSRSIWRGRESKIELVSLWSLPLDHDAEYELVIRRITKPGVPELKRALEAAKAWNATAAVTEAAAAIRELV